MANKKITFGFTAEQIISEGRVTRDDIDIIRRWSTNEKIPELTDEQIILFLLSCDNKHETTEHAIKAFYQIKKRSPFLFDNRNLDREDLQRQLQLGQFCILPERTDDGCVIMAYSIFNTLYSDFDVGAIYTLMLMTLDTALYEYPPKGLILVCDIKGFGFRHMTRLQFGHLRAFTQFLQEALPVKLKKIYTLNGSNMMDNVVKIMKPFFKKEVLDLVCFYTSRADMDEFHDKFIPKRYLPRDYGGNLPSVEELHRKNIEKLKKLQSHFDAEELQRRSATT